MNENKNSDLPNVNKAAAPEKNMTTPPKKI